MADKGGKRYITRPRRSRRLGSGAGQRERTNFKSTRASHLSCSQSSSSCSCRSPWPCAFPGTLLRSCDRRGRRGSREWRRWSPCASGSGRGALWRRLGGGLAREVRDREGQDVSCSPHSSVLTRLSVGEEERARAASSSMTTWSSWMGLLPSGEMCWSRCSVRFC